ncbi:DUF1302 domain-containing protein [Pelomonas sp. KK5]|uniref:DUF1302 domain-containing protein n=1 Tax=Pelomonas sp. KK5 TaxID=1855730 RepID=UPI00097BBE67|nr:DUF1302 family protein [Pelomonas sp. KK5]
MKERLHPGREPARMGAIATAVALLAMAMPALATTLDTGNPDLTVRWDNTVRGTLGVRLQDRAGEIDNAFGAPYDQSNALFPNKGDFIAKRLDLLSEFDLSWQRTLGFRLSGAAWYDAAYGNHAAATANPSAYTNNEFTSVVKRYYAGPSGEFLDAYVFGHFEPGGTAIDARLGKQAVIWGEGLFGSTNSMAYSQVPNDGRKGAANPGASAKETALPIEMASAVAQVSDQLSLAAFYTFKWRPNRLPEGGTYFAAADTILEGPNVGREAAINGKSGDFGLSLRWRPTWLDQGTIGFYARRFDEKQPWASQLDAATNLRHAVYAQGVQLYGVSLTKIVGGISLGSEISYRRNMPLNSNGAAVDGYGARGNTVHAVINGVASYGQTSIWSSSSLATELGVSYLDKVTQNPNLYKAEGTAGCVDQAILAGCSTRAFYTIGASFTPVWVQALPGVDVSLPIFGSYNFKGNAPTNSGGFEGFKVFKFGLSMNAYARHQLDLSFTRYWSKTGTLANGRQLVLGAPYNDKGNVTLTYQTTF